MIVVGAPGDGAGRQAHVGTRQLDSIAFTLTENHLREGGRPRHRLEVYLTLNAEQRAYFGAKQVTIHTDDGRDFVAVLSGNSGRRRPDTWKNLRAAKHFGEWLERRGGAVVGDQIRVTHFIDDTFFAEFLPNAAARASGLAVDRAA